MHAANSAAMLRDAGAQFDMVRCGIAIYGMDPFGVDPAAARARAGARAELLRRRGQAVPGRGRAPATGGASSPSATPDLGVLPIGYGDGWRRGLSNNADVLIAGARHPLVGTVSMDNITVDLGADAGAERLRGEPAILIGVEGEERITAEEVARRLDTINYEITCGLTPRVPRVYHRDGERARARSRDPRLRERAGRGSRPAMTDGLQAARTALAGRRAWLVGGAVRDRAARARDGRPRRRRRRRSRRGGARDRPRRRARGLLRALGGVRRLARVARDCSWQVDVEPLRGGSLEADLALRDFTVNAIAEPLARRRADRPARRPRGSRGRTAADGRRRAPSPTTRCACCAWCASPSSSASSPSPRRCARPRAHAGR